MVPATKALRFSPFYGILSERFDGCDLAQLAGGTIERSISTRKAHWLVVFLALGLLLPLFGILGVRLAQPASGATSPAAVQSPILGSFLEIWTGDGVDNYSPAVAYNSLHDEYLVVWENRRNGTWDVYARRVGGDGTLKSWFAVATGAGEKRWQPAVAYSPAQDEYLIVYTFDWGLSGDYDIMAKRVKWDGSWMSPAQFSIADPGDIQWHPAVAYNSQDDEYLVVYENEWVGGLRDIAVQRVKASDGSLLSWANVATGVGERRFFPDVAYNATRNEYLIAYTLGGTFPITPTPELGDIYGKVAAADLAGVSVSSEIAICDDVYDKGFVSVAVGPDEYLVVWEGGTVLDTDFDIYARRVSGAGTPQGPSGGFPIAAATTNFHGLPDVAYGAGYGYLVAWEYYDPGPSGQDIYARYVMPGHNSAAGDEFGIDDMEDSQGDPAVACALSGDCLVVEEDNFYGGIGVTDYEIRGRFVMPHRVYLPLVLKNY